MKRVVITGMGIYSCIGKNLDEVKDSLYNGKSGIGIDPVRKELGYFSALTGILERPELKSCWIAANVFACRSRVNMLISPLWRLSATLASTRLFSKPTKWVSYTVTTAVPLPSSMR